ncbi:MAG: double zinc ribbon domain-containing protein [bacterium]
MLATRAANLFYDSCLALLYPQACAICGDSVESRELGVACEKCWQATQVFDGNETICWKCGALSLGSVAPEQREEVRCRRCDADSFTVARACGTYEGALRASVLLLKREPHLCRKLIDLLVKVQRRDPLNQATRIVPVPLHQEREKARGFNQAGVIGRALARAVSLPVDEISLKRNEHTTRHRAGMDARDRRESVAKAFTVSYPALIAGERILLIDDVFTSGATVSACANVLLQAGAADVFVLTIARPLLY